MMYQYRNASQLRSPTNLFEQNAVELVKVKSIGETEKESGSWRSAGLSEAFVNTLPE
jgi:hypothetical protein